MKNLGIHSAGRYGVLLIAVATLVGAAHMARTADVPNLMNYQGVLTDANGDPLEITQATLTFNIYGSATGGAPVWGPMIFDNGAGDGHGMSARIVDGRFNVVLGPVDTASRPLSAAFLSGANRFLEITVDDNPPIQPRLALLSAPYAIQARQADRAGGLVGQIIQFWIDNNLLPAMVIDNSGNVGIGTSNPSQRLHVVGSTLITGPSTINGFQPLYTFAGGSTNVNNRYVHIKTPDLMRPLIIIGSDGEEVEATAEDIDEALLEAAAADRPADDGEATPDDIIINPYGDTHRHFMIEGIAPNARGGANNIISKRVSYTFFSSILGTSLSKQANIDQAHISATYSPVPVVYRGSDNYLYIRFGIPTGTVDSVNYTTQDMSFVLFGLRTHSGTAPLTGYSVIISSQLTL